jgi:protein TonB
MLGSFGGEGRHTAGRAAAREGNRVEDRLAVAQPEPRATAVRLGAFSRPHAPAPAAAAVATPAVREGVFQRVAPPRRKRAATLAARRGRYHPPVILSKPQPAYPPAARAAGAAGTVILRVLLTAAGRVRVLAVLHGLGPLLDRAAKTAAEGIRFRPARRGARALDAVVEVRVRFRLAE